MSSICLDRAVLKPLIVQDGCPSTNSSIVFCRYTCLYSAIFPSPKVKLQLYFSNSSPPPPPLLRRRNRCASSTSSSASTDVGLPHLDTEITLLSDPPVFADEIRHGNGEDRENFQLRKRNSGKSDEHDSEKEDSGRNKGDITLQSVNRGASGPEPPGMEIRVAEKVERVVRGEHFLFPLDTRLFVANFTHEVDGQALAQIFSEAGVVEIAEVIYNRETGSNRCFGFVTMSTAEEAKKAIEMFHGRNFCGRLLAVVKALNNETSIRRKRGYCLYVGNLPWEVDNGHLQKIFSRYGKVMDSRVMCHMESGLSRGYGFVTMSSETESNNAISALNGEALLGRVLKVSRALNKLSWQS